MLNRYSFYKLTLQTFNRGYDERWMFIAADHFLNILWGDLLAKFVHKYSGIARTLTLPNSVLKVRHL